MLKYDKEHKEKQYRLAECLNIAQLNGNGLIMVAVGMHFGSTTQDQLNHTVN
jgi:membrane protease subunit (stomatin/prohibitin family)